MFENISVHDSKSHKKHIILKKSYIYYIFIVSVLRVFYFCILFNENVLTYILISY